MAKADFKNTPLQKTKKTSSKDDKSVEQKVDPKIPHYEQASPTLLSQQSSVEVKQEQAIPQAEWGDLRSHLETMLISLRSWRESWWTQNWSDLAEFILPRRSIWLTQSTGGIPSPNNMTRGRQINNSIVDPTGTLAVRIAAGGLMSGLASPSRPWFKIVPALKGQEIDAAGRAWLDEVENTIYNVLSGSNFYNAFAQECEDLIVFGTSPCIIYEDAKDVIRCYVPCVGEYYLGSSSTMRVDSLYRQFVMTISQIVDFFGLAACPPEVQSLWAQKGNALNQEKIIAHSIEPNFGVGQNDAGKVKGNFTWRETYWVYGNASASPLSIRGFVDQAFTASRWATQSNDAYGRSPGMDVLPDIMQLQVETRRKAEAIEKLVRPPLIADMQLKNQPSSILPGHVTYVEGLGANTGMRSIYTVNPDIRAMMEDLKEIQQRIQRGFFNDLFLMLNSNPNNKMTAYEVAQKLQEKLQVLGPVIESLLCESLKPKLKRIFGILKRRGFINPPPDSMRKMPLEVDFVSMLALAQKASATGGLERIAALVGNMVAVFPEVKDVLDADTLVREMSDLLGNPQKLLFDPTQVAQTRAANAQAAAAASKMQALQHGAQTAKIGADAANTLSNTQIGGGTSALAAMLPQGVGPEGR